MIVYIPMLNTCYWEGEMSRVRGQMLMGGGSTKSAKNGIVSFAEGDEQRMMLMGLKRFTKYTHYPNVARLRSNISDKVSKENAYCF